MVSMRSTTRYLVLCTALASVASACGSNESRGSAGGDDTGAVPDSASPADGSTTAPDAGTDAGEDTVSPEELVEIVVDQQRVEIVNGSSDTIDFEIPENVVSVTVMVETDSGVTVALSQWTQANGDDLVPDDWLNRDQTAPSICTICDNRIAASETVFAAIAPNNETPEVVAGTHTIGLTGFTIEGFSGSPATATAYVTVYAKVMPEVPAEATLDLNLHFTGAGWTAETAQSDQEFQDILQEMADLYSQVNVSIGEVSYRDIGEEFQIVDGFQGPDNDLELLFRNSEGNERNTLNLFFVSELRQGGPFAGAGLVLGIAGGIPGPPLVQGTSRSGVAIAVDSHSNPQLPFPASLAKTMAHEAGHFLGLFHTSEQALFGPQIHDPIDDTPENDEDYLMFNTGQGDQISESQGVVMRINPWMRH